MPAPELPICYALAVGRRVRFGSMRSAGEGWLRLGCAARARYAASVAVFVIVASGALLLAPVAGAVSPLPAQWIRGAQITGYEPDTFNGSFATTTDAALRQLKADGGNVASFVNECYMQTYQSTTIDCTTPYSETDASLAAGMDYARSIGLQVALNPHVDTQDSYFRGQIQPNPWWQWWDSYDGMILHYAQLAQQHRALIFYVGTELDSASTCAGAAGQDCAAEWHGLISSVRQVFHGVIAYAASAIYTEYPSGSGMYEPAYKLFPAWDAVDLIGVDSYFELDLPKGGGGTPDPGVPALNAAWNSFATEYGGTSTAVGDLHALSTQYHKLVFASEMGFSDGQYAAHDPASTCPDESNPCTDTVDLQAQADGYESYFETFSGLPWYDGMVLWDFQIDQPPSLTELQVDPRGKPAEQVIRAWWTAGTNPPPPPPGPSVPKLSALTVSPRRFHVGRGGTTISWIDTEASVATLTFKQALVGVPSGRSCVAPRHPRGRHAKTCTRWVTLSGSVMHADAAGADSVRFSARLRGHALSPGRYEVAITARAGGLTSHTLISAPFSVLR